MADILKLKPFILRWEGGFSNHPADKGGATNKGITIATFRQYFGAGKSVIDLKNMTDEQWLVVLMKGYWNPFKADKIKNQSIANICVDFAWNSGTGAAIRRIQRLFNLQPDGSVGPKTLAVLNGPNSKEIFENIKASRLAYVEAIVERNHSQAVFLRGWQNRINSIAYEA